MANLKRQLTENDKTLERIESQLPILKQQTKLSKNLLPA